MNVALASLASLDSLTVQQNQTQLIELKQVLYSLIFHGYMKLKQYERAALSLSAFHFSTTSLRAHLNTFVDTIIEAKKLNLLIELNFPLQIDIGTILDSRIMTRDVFSASEIVQFAYAYHVSKKNWRKGKFLKKWNMCFDIFGFVCF